ncbi:MAG: helix-turn-helix domain-containing protein [Spirochaetaceae bacterium]|jgi:transcriptional regulator with XRE-family HTH domain|nr:helix-turn-helix domain-containing protein [Spirochaetaceae bacterium]
MKDKKTAKKVSLVGDSSMGQRIVLLRHSLKLTQVEFARKIVISNGMIAAIELGKRRVNDRLLRLITITFGANDNWLRTGEGPMLEQDRTPDYKISEALEAFQKLSPPLQDIVLDHLHKLLAYEKTV